MNAHGNINGGSWFKIALIHQKICTFAHPIIQHPAGKLDALAGSWVPKQSGSLKISHRDKKLFKIFERRSVCAHEPLFYPQNTPCNTARIFRTAAEISTISPLFVVQRHMDEVSASIWNQYHKYVQTFEFITRILRKFFPSAWRNARYTRVIICRVISVSLFRGLTCMFYGMHEVEQISQFALSPRKGMPIFLRVLCACVG